MANDSDRKHSVQPNDTLELRDIVLRVWRGKWIVIGLVAVASVLSVLYALAQPNIYRADAVLAPNRSEGAQGLQGLANQYSGLASLAA